MRGRAYVIALAGTMGITGDAVSRGQRWPSGVVSKYAQVTPTPLDLPNIHPRSSHRLATIFNAYSVKEESGTCM